MSALHGLALLLAGGGLAAAQAGDGAAGPSPWYLERPAPAAPDAGGDRMIETALLLAATLQDGSVPGFYDGQFQHVADRFDELARIAHAPELHHVLRVVAVMAIAEAASGPAVEQALQPLLIPPLQEFGTEMQSADGLRAAADDPEWIASVRRADLSLYARFALAKDGQSRAILEKIEVLEQYVRSKLDRLLDPSIDSDAFADVRFGRQVLFDIGYHYQQFDDFENAALWFGRLCDHLPGHRETRWAHYNLACIRALGGRPDEALSHLAAAHAVGFTDAAWMEKDGDLISLRGRPEFRALAAAMRNQVPPLEPAPEPVGGGR